MFSDAQGRRWDRISPTSRELGIYHFRALETETRIPFEETALKPFQDEFLVGADKPHFLPAGSRRAADVQETLLGAV